MLFEVEPKWRDHWWGMPSYTMEDARAQHKLVMNFITWTDYHEFIERLGLEVLGHKTSAWYPNQKREQPADWAYEDSDKAIQPEYPIYIPSKGRHDITGTAVRLNEMGANYILVVEPPEAELYQKRFGYDKVAVLPFADLGQGSIPARNWIWDDAKKRGHKWHWLIDDNHKRFWRLNLNRRIPVRSPAMFRAAEVFADRYDNVAFVGFNDKKWLPDAEPRIAAFSLNTRIYSVTLIRTDLEIDGEPLRWRGRYNEDTDLCLRALKAGWSTIQFNTFLGEKAPTKTSGQKGTKGGNTDTVYAGDDHRLAFAESLKAQHPDVVEVVWKYNRWHHQVDYTPFKKNRLGLRPDVTPMGRDEEFGMRLIRVKDQLADGADQAL
jgi:hypothetical protein